MSSRMLGGQIGGRTVSADNTANQVVLDLGDLHDTLSIRSVASGVGSATLTVEASDDNVNWLTVDSLAAAATQAKLYSAATAGATVAISPLSFRYVRITAGASGAGTTTTLTISAK